MGRILGSWFTIVHGFSGGFSGFVLYLGGREKERGSRFVVVCGFLGFVWVYYLLALCSSRVGVSCDVIRLIDVVATIRMVAPGVGMYFVFFNRICWFLKD